MRISDGSSDVCSSDLGIRHDLSCRSPQTVEKAVNSMQRDSHRPEESVPYVIVVGSEKGGTGKSTTAIHLTVGLMKLGFRVGTIDLDARQGTFTAFWRNRAAPSEPVQDRKSTRLNSTH